MHLLHSNDPARGPALDPASLPYADASLRDARPAPAAPARRGAQPAFTRGVFGDLLPSAAPTVTTAATAAAASASAAAAAAAASAMAPAETFESRGRIAGLLLLQCGLLLLVALVSPSWFTGPGGTLGVLGIEECSGTVCHTLSWLDAQGAATELQALSVTALLGGLVAVGFLLQAGVVLVAGQPDPRVRGLGISLGVAALGLTSFFALVDASARARGIHVSWAGVLAIATVVGAAVLLVTLVRPLARRPTPRPTPRPAPRPAP